MLWIINGLIYGFFTALYTLVNQRHNFNGYILGIWRGFGISLLFIPFMFFIPWQTNLNKVVAIEQLTADASGKGSVTVNVERSASYAVVVTYLGGCETTVLTL